VAAAPVERYVDGMFVVLQLAPRFVERYTEPLPPTMIVSPCAAAEVRKVLAFKFPFAEDHEPPPSLDR
jgi:hypothetical protein